MADSNTSANPLISTTIPDGLTSVQLHPLVLLTISDYVTRHTIRQQSGPIVGSIIGEQTGNALTLEAAYECKLAAAGTSDIVDPEFFTTRLEQYKDVFKVPPLDFVGVFMLGPADGPTTDHVSLVKQVQGLTSNDSVILLLFHPELVDELQGGKLPLTLYESVHEQDGSDLQIRFREVSFEVETGDAERIGVDFVAQGGGNATAVRSEGTAQGSSSLGSGATETSSKESKAKGKSKANDEEKEENGEETPSHVISPEDEELIAALTAKSNAIKMLLRRIKMIQMYLSTLPPSYLTDSSLSSDPAPDTNYSLLRSIKAMVSRLPLITPPSALQSAANGLQADSPETVVDKEKQDVYLTSLLANLTRAVSEAQSMGAKFSIVQRDKSSAHRGFGAPKGPGKGAFEDNSLSTKTYGGW